MYEKKTEVIDRERKRDCAFAFAYRRSDCDSIQVVKVKKSDKYIW